MDLHPLDWECDWCRAAVGEVCRARRPVTYGEPVPEHQSRVRKAAQWRAALLDEARQQLVGVLRQITGKFWCRWGHHWIPFTEEHIYKRHCELPFGVKVPGAGYTNNQPRCIPCEKKGPPPHERAG